MEIAALYKLPSAVSSHLLTAKVFNYIELASSRPAAMIRKTDWIVARVALWDTALKFLSPGPRNDVTDHLVRFIPKYILLTLLLPFLSNNLGDTKTIRPYALKGHGPISLLDFASRAIYP